MADAALCRCSTTAASSPSAGLIAAAFLQGLVSNDVDKVGPAQARLCRAADRARQIPARFHDGRAGRGDLARRRSGAPRRSQAAAVDVPAARQGRRSTSGPISRWRRCSAATRSPRSVFRPSPAPRGPLLRASRLSTRGCAALGARCILPRDASAEAALAAAGWSKPRLPNTTGCASALGVPDGSRDLVLDKSILLEAGFDELNGVDWNKGCYIGQELTARTKYRGLIKRRLVPVRIDGPAARAGHNCLCRRARSRRDAVEPRRARAGAAAN